MLLVLLQSPAHADWVNLGGAEVAPNIAEIFVEDDGVRVALEVFVEDMKAFSDLVPAEWAAESGVELPADTLRLARFGREGLVIRADDGAPLPVQLLNIERRLRVDRASPLAGSVDPYSGRVLPKPPEDPRVLYVELFYDFDGTRPGQIDITPPMENDGPAASIGMVVFHDAVPVIDFRYLSAAATLTLDWDDPWYSSFSNPNLNRHHRYPRMVFLYAEPYEIRQEALVRVRDAAERVGLPVSGETLTAEEATELANRVAKEIGSETPLSIEGRAVIPDFSRSAFMRIGMRGLEFLQPGEQVNVNADILGLIWSAPTDGLPQSAALEWNWFDEKTPQVAAYAVDAAGPFLAPLTADDRVLTWTNHFKKSPYPEIAAVSLNRPEGLPQPVLWLLVVAGAGVMTAGLGAARSRRPLIGIGLVVAIVSGGAAGAVWHKQSTAVPDLDAEQMTALTTDLLNNVYRAFDFRLEDQVYDRLALTLDGEILEQVYLDQRQSLRVERAGGADARVEDLIVESVEPQDGAAPGTLKLRSSWKILGSVGHWGHTHRRANAYEADLVLAPVEDHWKIRAFDVRSQERLQ